MTIRVGEATWHINRPVVRVLADAAEAGHLLVTGEPGAGKSAILSGFVAEQRRRRRDVVYFSADQFAAGSLGELRQELGLGYDVAEVLASWTGGEPAYLVIDALDAARADAIAHSLRELIALVIEARSRWRVVASIRSYDLRHASELAGLFPLDAAAPLPPTYTDPEVPSVRLLRVPRLTDAELDAALAKAPALAAAVAAASADLRELLHVPFNLRLAAELSGQPHGAADLAGVHSQLDLLGRYWQLRILELEPLSERAEREAVLTAACEEMVRLRSLTAPLRALPVSDQRRRLLSAQVLAEGPSRSTVAFSHHLLFDYAGARLLFDGPPDVLRERLAKDPSLVLFARPSLDLHFADLWLQPSAGGRRDRAAFWDAAFGLATAAQVPQLGLFLLAAVVVRQAADPDDLERLGVVLDGEAGVPTERAEAMLRAVVLAVQTLGGVERVRQSPSVWVSAADRWTRHPRVAVREAMWPLLEAIFESIPALPEAEQRLAARVARRLLAFERTVDPGSWPTGRAARWVARTYTADPVEAEALLTVATDPAYVAAHGHQEIDALAGEFRHLLGAAPDLMEHVYARAFEGAAASHAHAHLAAYELAERFPDFLATAPAHAGRTLADAMTQYIAARHPVKASLTPRPFTLWGQTIMMAHDLSAFWDEGGTYASDDAVRLLDAFTEWLANGPEAPHVRAALGGIASRAAPAVIWRRVLRSARDQPVVGDVVRELLWAPYILGHTGTSFAATEWLARAYPHLDPVERRQVERAILSLSTADTAAELSLEGLERLRGQLLGVLPPSDLVTHEARAARAALDKAGGPPIPRPYSRGVQVTWGDVTEDEILREQGVPLNAPETLKLRVLIEPIQEFIKAVGNEAPAQQASDNVLPALMALRRALELEEGAAPALRARSVVALTTACEHIARNLELSAVSALGQLVREVLLAAAGSPYDAPLPDELEQFERSPSWSGDNPLIDAAQGLRHLLANPSFGGDTAVQQAAGRLLEHPHPAVRLQLAGHLGPVLERDIRLGAHSARAYVELLAGTDSSRQVVAAVCRSAWAVAHVLPTWSASVAQMAYDRLKAEPGADAVRLVALGIITWVTLYRDEVSARALLRRFTSPPIQNPESTAVVLQHLRHALLWHGPAADPECQRAHREAVALFTSAVASAHEAVVNGAGVATPSPDSAAGRAVLAAAVGELLRTVRDEPDDAAATPSGTPSIAEVHRRLVDDLGPALDQLIDFVGPGEARMLWMALARLAKATPDRILPRVRRLLEVLDTNNTFHAAYVGKSATELLSWYLGSRRALFRTSDALARDLLTSLDLLVRRGEIDALRLAFRAEEIYR